MTEIRLRILSSLSQISPSVWDACAAGEADRPEPFLTHAFLQALEDSGCATARTGWAARHLVLEGPDGSVWAVAPAYLKSHSRGEYVFDQGWAQAYEQAGGHYYPKLQVSVPFTPVTGRRLLVRPGVDVGVAQARLAAGLVELARQSNASSVHVTFATQVEWAHLGQLGYLQRLDQQFQWTNLGYRTFEEFLDHLSSRKRKAIRRERRAALASGLEVQWLTGSDLTEAAWDAFFAFYLHTGERKWGRPYLNRRFFSLLGERMADRVLLVMAVREGRYIAGALNLIGAHTLYGRYWGALEEHPFLHFEICYHQAVDYAIAHHLAVVEAGAQGEHKLARGYLPVETHSAHFIADPALRRAVAHYLDHERAQMTQIGAELAELGPYRRGEAPGEGD